MSSIVKYSQLRLKFNYFCTAISNIRGSGTKKQFMIRTVAKTVIVAFSIAAITTSPVHAQSPKNQIIFDQFDIVAARKANQVPYVKPDIKDLARIEEELRKEREEEERISQRAANIRDYLRERGAPLAEYARTIVIMGEKYGVEPELIAAISIIESGGGRVNFRPYNAWGWGQRGWTSWEEAIEEYAKGLYNGYISKGNDTPREMAPFYCPPNQYNWANKVSYVLAQIIG